MNTDLWQRVKDLYAEACSLDSHARTAFLDGACADNAELRAEVNALLAAGDQAPPLLDRPALESFAELLLSADHAEALVGRRLGVWRLTRVIAAGGMGVVYAAERDDGQFQQTVAIKLIQRDLVSPELIRRFQQERQTLAHLDHANIARLLDGGLTDDGLPYLVMEHVVGRPIDVYCDEQGLSTPQRLGLFQTVCAAAQHAHQNLVIHCDLKPGNILVAPDGTPKLLDFGIARVLRTHNAAREPPRASTAPQRMTPEYASPEQVRGQPVTTATDVYALGVLLYELLTGLRPYRFPSRYRYDIERAICEQEPLKPSTAVRRAADPRTSAEGSAGVSPARPRRTASTLDPQAARRLRRRLSGDLDAIALKAMAKDPRQRYASVEQLAEDIRRHLSGLPVGARLPTLRYRTAKFLRRNWAPLSAAAALAASLVIGVVATAWQAHAARRERDRAFVAQATAEQINQFLQNMLASADPAQVGPDATVRQVLDQAAARVGVDLYDRPEVEAAARRTLGNTYLSLALYDQAQEQLEAALGLFRRVLGKRHPTVASVLGDLGRLMYARRDLDQAEAICRQALDIARQTLAPTHPDLATGVNNLAAVLRARGDLDAAEELHQEALAIRRRAFGREHEAVAESLNNLAAVLFARQRYEEALPLTREALAIRRKTLGDQHPLVLQSMANLGRLLANLGHYAEAEPLLEEALRSYRQRHGDQHPDVGVVHMHQGALYLAIEQYERAEAAFRAGLQIFRLSFGEDDRRTLTALRSLGDALAGLRRYPEAEAILLDGLARMERLLGADDPATRALLASLARLYEAWGQPEKARPYRARLPAEQPGAADGGG